MGISVNDFINIMIAVGVVWVVLSVFSFMQNVQLRSIYNILSDKGRIVTGRDKGIFLTKYQLFTAVSKEGKVVDARLLKVVRFVTPPKVLECPQMIGLDLNTFTPESLDVDPRIQLAAGNLKISWVKLKPAMKRDISSIAPKTDNEEKVFGLRSYDSAEQELQEHKFLDKAEHEIRKLLADEKLNINGEPLGMVLDALRACDQTYCFSTDEVIADKAYQLSAALLSKSIDISKVDGLVETILLLIAQREREAHFQREKNK